MQNLVLNYIRTKLQESHKLLQMLGISHAAFLSVIFGMMLLSFPLGVFVVFHSNVGDNINFEYPVISSNLFGNNDLFFEISLGDVFIVFWTMYAIFFTIAIFGPRKGFLQILSVIITDGKITPHQNYLVLITKWFSILILVSAIITYTQEFFGIQTLPPVVGNDLMQFFYISLSPLTEEIGFRSLLIGIPIFLMYSHRFSIIHFFKSIWNPMSNIHVYSSKRSIALVVITGVIFGFAHIALGEPWSEGKFLQASASGIILGWLYIHAGLLAAIMVHWGTNYFIFAYANFISQTNEIALDASFYHPLLNTMEIVFLISGILSIAMLIFHKIGSKNNL